MSKLFTTRRRIVIVGITGAVVLGGAGAAFAYFTASGQGTGTGSVGSATSFNVVVGTPTGGPLYPGAGTETFGYTITNTGTGNQGLQHDYDLGGSGLRSRDRRLRGELVQPQ